MSHFLHSKNFFLSVVYFCVMGFSALTHAQAQTTLRITTIPEEAATEQVRKFTPLATYLSLIHISEPTRPY